MDLSQVLDDLEKAINNSSDGAITQDSVDVNLNESSEKSQTKDELNSNNVKPESRATSPDSNTPFDEQIILAFDKIETVRKCLYENKDNIFKLIEASNKVAREVKRADNNEKLDHDAKNLLWDLRIIKKTLDDLPEYEIMTDFSKIHSLLEYGNPRATIEIQTYYSMVVQDVVKLINLFEFCIPSARLADILAGIRVSVLHNQMLFYTLFDKRVQWSSEVDQLEHSTVEELCMRFKACIY